MNVVLSVCRKVIVNDQGNLLDVNPTSLKGKRKKEKAFQIIFKSRDRWLKPCARVNVARI